VSWKSLLNGIHGVALLNATESAIRPSSYHTPSRALSERLRLRFLLNAQSLYSPSLAGALPRSAAFMRLLASTLRALCPVEVVLPRRTNLFHLDIGTSLRQIMSV
jgi:hypothetical protein